MMTRKRRPRCPHSTVPAADGAKDISGMQAQMFALNLVAMMEKIILIIDPLSPRYHMDNLLLISNDNGRAPDA